MEALQLTRSWSVYEENCIKETETSVYGRDNRRPIHDAILYCAEAATSFSSWCEDIGLCEQNGKLCVRYDPDGNASSSAGQTQVTISREVREALDGILTDVYASDVRQDIVDALALGGYSLGSIVDFLNGLRLRVANGMLCYTDEDVLDSPTTSSSSITERILTEVNGKQLREAIVEALRWGTGVVSTIGDYIDSLGLIVYEGKLCVV